MIDWFLAQPPEGKAVVLVLVLSSLWMLCGVIRDSIQEFTSGEDDQ